MNEEKLEEVSKMLDIDSSDAIYSKRRRFYKRTIFSLIQVGFFLTSSLLSIPFGQWDSKNSTYPYASVAKTYTWGTLTLFSLGTGNFTISFATRKRLGIDKILTAFVVLLNLTLSIVTFFLIFNEVYTPLTSIILYNVHSKEN